jgi:hypothetical protein
MICVKCGEEMRMTEKDTSSGRDIREYLCPGCGYSDWEVHGTALWQILSDDREEFEREKAEREAAEQRELKGPQPLKDSAWDRIRALFHKEKQ